MIGVDLGVHSSRLNINIKRTNIRIDKDGDIAEIFLPKRLFAHQMIEECMVAANICAAKFIKKHYGFGVYRVHEEPEKLKIEKGISKPNQFWEYFRIWAFVVVEKPKHPWYPAHIVITSKGERVPIGDFLTEKEKLDLVDKLRNIIDSLK